MTFVIALVLGMVLGALLTSAYFMYRNRPMVWNRLKMCQMANTVMHAALWRIAMGMGKDLPMVTAQQALREIGDPRVPEEAKA